MKNISQSVCLIGFLVLMIATCMAGTAENQARINDHPAHLRNKLNFDDCVTLTMKDKACHKGECSSSVTNIHTCDYYNSSNCDYYSGHIDICNSTHCDNTTRQIVACYNDVSDNCGDADITCHSCTNDNCRNRTTHFHACYTDTKTLNSAASNFCNGCYIGVYAFDCIGNLIQSFGRRIGGAK